MSKNIIRKRMWLIGSTIIAMMGLMFFKPCDVKADKQTAAEIIIEKVKFFNDPGFLKIDYVEYPIMLITLQNDIIKNLEEIDNDAKFENIKAKILNLPNAGSIDRYSKEDVKKVRQQFYEIFSDIKELLQQSGVSVDFSELDKFLANNTPPAPESPFQKACAFWMARVKQS